MACAVPLRQANTTAADQMRQPRKARRNPRRRLQQVPKKNHHSLSGGSFGTCAQPVPTKDLSHSTLNNEDAEQTHSGLGTTTQTPAKDNHKICCALYGIDNTHQGCKPCRQKHKWTRTKEHMTSLKERTEANPIPDNDRRPGTPRLAQKPVPTTKPTKTNLTRTNQQWNFGSQLGRV